MKNIKLEKCYEYAEFKLIQKNHEYVRPDDTIKYSNALNLFFIYFTICNFFLYNK